MTVHDNNMTTSMLVPNVPIHPAPAAGKSKSVSAKYGLVVSILGRLHDLSELSPRRCVN
jgi:hypothetical protein